MGFSTNLRGLRSAAMAVLEAANETEKTAITPKAAKTSSWNAAAKHLVKVRLSNV